MGEKPGGTLAESLCCYPVTPSAELSKLWARRKIFTFNFLLFPLPIFEQSFVDCVKHIAWHYTVYSQISGGWFNV